jgi:hypothetical protein
MPRGRKRKIPKQSKKLKYFYIIKVNFKGKDVLKVGISNNGWRRMREYNNSDKTGFLKDIFHVYTCSNPRRLETLLKYYLPQFGKTIFKFEYWDLKFYDIIMENLFKLSEQFGYKLEEFDYYEKCNELIKN